MRRQTVNSKTMVRVSYKSQNLLIKLSTFLHSNDFLAPVPLIFYIYKLNIQVDGPVKLFFQLFLRKLITVTTNMT